MKLHPTEYTPYTGIKYTNYTISRRRNGYEPFAARGDNIRAHLNYGADPPPYSGAPFFSWINGPPKLSTARDGPEKQIDIDNII